MNNKAIIITIMISALAGAGVALSLGKMAASQGPLKTDSALVNRVSKLEAELSAEREARTQLIALFKAQSVQDSSFENDPQPTQLDSLDDLVNQDLLKAEQGVAETTNNDFEFSTTSRADSRRQNEKRALIAGGFDETEANWVLDSESQVQLEELYEQHQLRRASIAKQSDEANPWINRKSRQERLRQKLGDQAFEKYLKAHGWSTSAQVQNVIGGSPAELAGLKSGDKITRYAGERVYNLRDINRLTLQGTEGDSVLIEVERDGNQVQVTLPRGPIGVSGG